MYLEDEQWIEGAFVPGVRSRGESWVVLDRPELERAWLQAASGHLRAGGHPKTATGRGRGSRTIPVTLRFEVLRRDDFRCTYCGRRPPEAILNIDHVTPWAGGRAPVLDNLRTACSECNLGKGAKRLG